MKQTNGRWGNPLVRLHTRLVDFPPSCESAASQYRVGLLRFESGCVLVFHGGVFECSSRMNGKPSSPVLRGLGASNGARPLDSNCRTRLAYTTSGPSKCAIQNCLTPRRLLQILELHITSTCP